MDDPYLLAIDPGESTGWCLMTKQGEDYMHGITRSREDLYDVLEKMVPDTVELVVIEDFRLFQHKALQQSGSSLETVRVIGAVESWANLKRLEVILQPASILPIAKLWSGVVPKGAHKNNHHISALHHGYYYLQKNGIITPKKRG